MVVVARSLRLVSVGAGMGVPRWDGGGGVDVGMAVDGGVAGISGGTAGSSSGEASSRVRSSGVIHSSGWQAESYQDELSHERFVHSKLSGL
jgi:hypothetical protein